MGTVAQVLPPTGRFVICHYPGARLPFLLALELDGAPRCWALPKEPSVNPNERRLALRQGPRPLSELANEEQRWDAGTWRLESGKPEKLVFHLAGQRLQGRYTLLQTRGESWMLFKTKAESKVAPARRRA